MAVLLAKELEKLKKMIVHFTDMIQEDLDEAIKSILTHDQDLAQHVIDSDEELNNMEVEIEEECLKALALFQPVAQDLRYIVAVLKLNSDLERIGDLAVNIADVAIFFSNKEKLDPPFNIDTMTTKVKQMVNKSLLSLVDLNSVLAREVLELDREIDTMHAQNYILVENKLVNDIENTSTYLHYLSVSRYLERIADHATNIAEDVIYTTKGEIIRHQ